MRANGTADSYRLSCGKGGNMSFIDFVGYGLAFVFLVSVAGFIVYKIYTSIKNRDNGSDSEGE